MLCVGVLGFFRGLGPNWVAVLITLAGILGLGMLFLEVSGRLPSSTRGSTMTEWWYNNKTKQVEEGPQSLGSDRDGPYATREDAERAPEIAAERARKWAAEDD